MRKALTAIVATALACLPSVAHAQMVQRPQRPFVGLFGGGAPPDPNRNRQELTLTGSVLGGYDDWISPPGTTGVQPGTQREGGTSALFEGWLRYFHGRAARSFSAEGRGATTAQRGFSSAAAAEGSLRLEAGSVVGPVDRIEISQDLAYEPAFSLGESSVPVGNGPTPLPGSGASTGILEQRSWFSSTALRADQAWTARHLTDASYEYSQRVYLDDFGNDMQSHVAALRHSWNVRRSISLDGHYRYSDVRMTDPAGVETPLSDHALQGGATYTRGLSPTRQFRVGGSAGATYVSRLNTVDRTPEEYWTPVAEASCGVDIGRSWSIDANYRRAVNVLPGVTLQTFATNSASLRTDGSFGARVEAALSATFSNGRSGGGESPGRYETYTAVAQLRFALARWASAAVSYDYYYYNLRDIPDVPTGLPPQYDRNAVRVGFTIWLPLYGSYTRGAAQGGGR